MTNRKSKDQSREKAKKPLSLCKPEHRHPIVTRGIPKKKLATSRDGALHNSLHIPLRLCPTLTQSSLTFTTTFPFTLPESSLSNPALTPSSVNACTLSIGIVSPPGLMSSGRMASSDATLGMRSMQ